MRRLRALVWKVVKRSSIAIVIVLVLLLLPVGYVELACRGDQAAQRYTPLIADAAFQRKEANTYLTYPEWHIVYAYDGLAEALKTGDEHAFDYMSSVAGFWRSTCALMRVADEHGGADGETRTMIHTIGVSFTAEMAAKAAYEETLGRVATWLRGANKTPQDKAVAAMAVDYAAFLRQTPWYQYDFKRESQKLWAAPVDGWLRGWERRLAVGTEFTAKRAYASVIGGAVAATGVAQVVIRSVVSGIAPAALGRIDGVKIVRTGPKGVEIETPRYDLFTRILADIATRGGTIVEIAGNDDIMLTLTVPLNAASPVKQGTVILRMTREGFSSERLLVTLKVTDLAALLRAHPIGDPGLEHVFDY
jgi:hypothetical protein